ncbi:TniB family NTP-binding protein [Streptomyces sp. NBC_01476]|uniref:TniB family NTP-binding protein n=1 Tax=Streptomyces sp. NBC_01476 TaxID=2903881 RepID=UPI002E32C0C0|nr:TniB family NTP-binding protein [Streptomyces sp. NBC_01476]
MSRAVDRLLSARIRQNAFKARPATRAGVIVSGGGYRGRTETVCEIAAAFEDSWRELHRTNPETIPGTRDAWVPVAYVQTPVTAKPKSACKAILDFHGAPTKRMDLPELVAQVAASLTDDGTKVLILDDITRLRCTAPTTRTPWT